MVVGGRPPARSWPPGRSSRRGRGRRRCRRRRGDGGGRRRRHGEGRLSGLGVADEVVGRQRTAVLGAGAVGPLLRRPVDADQHRLGAGDLAGREHDLGDGSGEVAPGEVEQGVVEVDLDDAVVDAHRAQLQRRRDRRAVAGFELAGVGAADQFGEQRLGIVVRCPAARCAAVARRRRARAGRCGPNRVRLRRRACADGRFPLRRSSGMSRGAESGWIAHPREQQEQPRNTPPARRCASGWRQPSVHGAPSASSLGGVGGASSRGGAT